MTPRERIRTLQTLLREHQIDAYIIPSADPHQSEYVAARWQARAWVSGFTGSAGTLVITQQRAGLWVDSRYHIRATREVEGSGIKVYKVGLSGVPSFADWLAQELNAGAVVGFDGRVFSVAEVTKLAHAFQDKRVTFSFERDLVGEIWTGRPAIPQNEIFIHDLIFAGQARTAKIQSIREQLAARNTHAQLISALDDIAWTLNLRGSDVECNPVAISYLVISRDAVRLFIDAMKIPPDVRAGLESDGVQILAYDEIYSYLDNLSPETTVLIDPDKTSYKLEQIVARACHTIRGTSIPSRLKAIKNETERDGIRQAHIRDGVAVVKWMYWLSQQTFEDRHTEITLAEKLDEFRSAGDHFQGPSFGAIVAYQANSAVGHYRAHADTTPTIRREGILLVDSGGQYLDGTTDITRTLTLGNPTPEQKRAFTSVLRGLIRLSQAQFPKGTQGKQLDALAREPLWKQGWICRHGIGHGVGCFLNVHEGPQGFSKTNTVAFEPGMVTTNEPGVYLEGRFGIRLENVLLTISEGMTEFGEFCGFETVALCPIDLKLVDSSLLSGAEKNWLNEYHQRVFQVLSPFLSFEETEWLRGATRAI